MDSPDVASYSERLWLGPVGWLCILGFVAFGFIALLPVDGTAAVVGAVALGAAGVVVAVVTATRVQVRGRELVVGRAHIPTALLSGGEVLDRTGVRAALGPGSDARTFVCVRAWIPRAVRLAVTDPADPTPAWLVSSRRPETLLAALRGSGAGDQAAHSVQTS